jgi:two-component system alkaline phosphatase synthesis response regulator PhoP
MHTVLVIDDDPAIRQGLEELLTSERLKVLTAETGKRGIAIARREHLDIIILDLLLPDIEGVEVCKELRKQGIASPILILSSKKHEVDKVLLLEMGADDYVTKPFGTRELAARIKALLRRRTEVPKDVEEYSFGSIVVDFKRQATTKKGAPIELTAREYKVLKYFVQHEGEVITRDMLLNDVWGYDQFPTTRTVDNYVLALRKKIEDDPAAPKHLLTIYTAGYKFIK